jgi:hypothetical protein
MKTRLFRMALLALAASILLGASSSCRSVRREEGEPGCPTVSTDNGHLIGITFACARTLSGWNFLLLSGSVEHSAPVLSLSSNREFTSIAADYTVRDVGEVRLTITLSGNSQGTAVGTSLVPSYLPEREELIRGVLVSFADAPAQGRLVWWDLQNLRYEAWLTEGDSAMDTELLALAESIIAQN